MSYLEIFAAYNINNNQPFGHLSELITPMLSFTSIALIFALIPIVIGIAFFIRWWFVQSAVFEMRDDLKEIKEYFVKDNLDLMNEDNLAKTSPTTKEEIILDEELENQPKITPKDSIKISAILNKQLPKWMPIVFLSIAAIFIFAILYINIFL